MAELRPRPSFPSDALPALGSRAARLLELDCEATPTARERSWIRPRARRPSVLSSSSIDDLAAASNFSRATLYRLFPGSPALFRELDPDLLSVGSRPPPWSRRPPRPDPSRSLFMPEVARRC